MDTWDIQVDERNQMVKLIQLPKNYFDLFSRRSQKEKRTIPHKNFIIYLSCKMEVCMINISKVENELLIFCIYKHRYRY